MEDPHTLTTLGKFYASRPKLYAAVLEDMCGMAYLDTLIRVMNCPTMFQLFTASTGDKYAWSMTTVDRQKSNKVTLYLHPIDMTGIYETFAECQVFMDTLDPTLRKVIIQDTNSTCVFMYYNTQIIGLVSRILGRHTDQKWDGDSMTIDVDASDIPGGAMGLFGQLIYDTGYCLRGAEKAVVGIPPPAKASPGRRSPLFGGLKRVAGMFVFSCVMGAVFHGIGLRVGILPGSVAWKIYLWLADGILLINTPCR